MFAPGGPTLRELAAQALSSTERGYDLLAPKFDLTPFRTPDPILAAAAELLSSDGRYESGLDLCCGTGAGMEVLRPLCRDRVVGVDFSQGMLEIGRRRIADCPGEARLEWVRANALSLPLRPEFDIAVTFGSCGHILDRDRGRFLQGVARVLRPGGRFVMVTCPMPPVSSPAFWTSRAFNAVMRARNALISPPFVMYYLTFLLPGILADLEAAGFQVEMQPIAPSGPMAPLRLVSATLASMPTQTH